MDYLITILCTMSGALAGTAVGTLLMFRRLQPKPAEVELNMWRETLRANESNLEKLQKQIADRDRTIRENAEEFNEKERQLGFALAETEKEAAQRAEAEQKLLELIAETAAQTEQRAELEARLQEEKNGAAEQSNLQVTRLTEECAELQSQLGAELERSRQLAGQVADLQNERQSAAKGIEMLLMAQQNLSHLLKPVHEEGHNGANGSASVEAAVILADRLQPAATEVVSHA